MKLVFAAHAVQQISRRHLNLDAVWQIARVGVAVEHKGKRVVKRGEYNRQAIDVVLEEPNVIVMAYPLDKAN